MSGVPVIVGGAAKLFYKAIDCQAQNIGNGSILSNGLFGYNIGVSAPPEWVRLFHLHFDSPIPLVQGQVNVTIHIDKNYNHANYSYMITSDWEGNNLLGSCNSLIQMSDTDAMLESRRTGQYTDLYFFAYAQFIAAVYNIGGTGISINGQSLTNIAIL